MLPFFLFTVLSPQELINQNDFHMPAWAVQALGSPRAVRVLEGYQKQPKPVAAAPAPAMSTTVRPGQKSQLQEGIFTVIGPDGPVAGEASQHAAQLLAADRSQEAFDYLQSFRAGRPVMAELTSLIFVKCALVARHFDEAYDELVVKLSDKGTANDQRLLAFSLACAARGEVYPGQYEYTKAWIKEATKDDPSIKVIYPKETNKGPLAIMLLSTLALGTRGTEAHYLEMAIELDSGCEMAGRELVDYYAFWGRNSDATRVATTVAEHLEKGASRDWFIAQAAKCSKLPDKPRQGAIPPP